MLRFTPYLLKTLWRHRTRSLLTISGAAVALFVFCMIGAVQQGLDNLSSQDDSVLVVFQANKFCPATSHLPQDYEMKIRRIPGVREVVPIQVFTNNCRASLDVVVFYGTPAKLVRQVRDFELLSGDWNDFEQRQDAAIVGQALANRRRLKLGDRFSVGDVSVRVAGIFRSSTRSEEDYVYCHLDFLQRTRGLDLVGTVTQHEVFLDPSADPQAVARQIDDTFRGGAAQSDTRTKGVFQASSLADLIDLIGFAHYLSYACVGLMLVLVSTTTFMAVQDRIREHALLQTLGFSPARVFRLVLTESVLLSLVGGAAGIAIAQFALSASGLSIGAEAVTISFAPSWRVAGFGLALSGLVGVAAGVFPALRAAVTDVVGALRYAG